MDKTEIWSFSTYVLFLIHAEFKLPSRVISLHSITWSMRSEHHSLTLYRLAVYELMLEGIRAMYAQPLVYNLWKWFPTSTMWDSATEPSHLAASTFTYSSLSPAPTAFFISQNYLAYVLYITYKDFSYILFFHMEIYHEFISLEKETSYNFNWDHIEFNWRIYSPIPKMGYNLLHKVFQCSLLNMYLFFNFLSMQLFSPF